MRHTTLAKVAVLATCLAGCSSPSGGAPPVVVVGPPVDDGGMPDGTIPPTIDGSVEAGDAISDTNPSPDAQGCTASEKLCGANCVPVDDPTTGCAAADCQPCALTNAKAACSSSGVCSIGSCDPGFGDCDQDAGDGCEVDTTTNANCGSCGNACPSSAPLCASGPTGYACGTTCGGGQTLCGSACADLTKDNSHCGSCTIACTADAGANGTEQCISSTCTPQCVAGAQLCGGSCYVLDTTHGVFVHPSSTAVANCGAPAVPCASIKDGLSAAASSGKTVLYLDQGTYAEQVTLTAGITLRGGWVDSGGTWTKHCDAAANTLSVIAPTTANKTVVATGVTATLDTLTVASKTAAPNIGESLYGVFATSGANLTLNDVVVSVAAGGSGAPGGTGAAGSGTLACTTGSGGGNGAAGSSGSAGGRGAYGSGGYQPGAAGTGSVGNAGSNEPGAVGTLTCNGCTGDPVNGCTGTGSNTFTSGTPGPGCGGNPGSGGSGGTGGGASIGVYSWGATVYIQGGSLKVQSGGTGGQGGTGGAGAAGTHGAQNCSTGVCGGGCATDKAGDSVCKGATQKPVCGTPGVGATGGAGGQGGGGAGGDSFDWVTGGGGTVTPTGGVQTSFPSTGAPGGAPTTGAVGSVGIHSP